MDAGTKGRAATVAGGVCCLAMACGAGGAHATPVIESTRLDGAVAGRQVELRIRAADPAAPVTGLVVGFGRGESGFGLSNCLPPDSAGRPFGPASAPGVASTLAAPHVFATPGTRTVAARVTSAGCTGGQAPVLQRLEVPVARPGTTPDPIRVLAPVTLPLGRPGPALPGLGDLPLSRVDLPVNLLGSLSTATMAANCPGSTTRFRQTRAGERNARRALLCLLNAERTRRGLRPMRGNGRLLRAARGHSGSMVTRRFFAHVGPGALDLAGRLRRTHYIPRRGGTWLIGENIGFGRGRMSRPLNMHLAWMHSTPHRAAILERRFREVGFGVVRGRPYGGGGATFTADFGRTR